MKGNNINKPSKAHTTKTWAQETGITSRKPLVLLTSVFGPYAKVEGADDVHTFSMELYNNQITRAQGVFSVRNFHHSWGIRMIQANISVPSAVLDFPTLDTFKKELTSHHYDIIGITSIIMNMKKTQEMCKIIRELSPHSKIVVGGHVAAIPNLEKMIDADHIAKGDGISWMRKYLSEDANAPVHHPALKGGFGFRVMGIPKPDITCRTKATIVSSVGCPMGCSFCATSAFFGGKGRFVTYLKTGKELFQAMCNSESALKTHEFFIMDENFLLNKPRAMELLELMKAGNKSWALSVFASANALKQYTMEELVELGIVLVWIGLESPSSQYEKLKDSDTMKLVGELQDHGISVCGSTIIGLEHHTPENIIEEVEYAIAHDADFHQFMLYIPFPGTPLYKEMEEEGRLLDIDHTGFPGLHRFSFKHKRISRAESEKLINWAFQHDFEQNGPSIYRFIKTNLKGWKRYKNHPDKRIRKRFHVDVQSPKITSGALWAMEQMYKDKDRAMSERIHTLREEFKKEFGMSSFLFGRLLGPLLLWTARREEKRMARGVTYEPKTFIERKNWIPGR